MVSGNKPYHCTTYIAQLTKKKSDNDQCLYKIYHYGRMVFVLNKLSSLNTEIIIITT